jgi:hypothetical protein
MENNLVKTVGTSYFDQRQQVMEDDGKAVARRSAPAGSARAITSRRWRFLMHARLMSVLSQLAELCLFFAAAVVLAVGLMSMR